MTSRCIKIRGARQNNLKGFDLDLPLNRLTVVTGVSGSGKSSLAFDTLYAEGQRRYVETFSPYARQFMDRMDRPRVDSIEAVPPAIAIDRKDPVRTSRSTVGTMAEITDHVKLLFARRAMLHCHQCGQPVAPASAEAIWDRLQPAAAGQELIVTFPFAVSAPQPERTIRQLLRLGYDRLWRDGAIVALSAWPPSAGQRSPAVAADDPRPQEEITVDVVADRARSQEEIIVDVVADRARLTAAERPRIVDSIEQALRFGGGRVDLWLDRTTHLPFSAHRECPRCQIAYGLPLPSLFSFNSPVGACDTCRGFGRVIDIDLSLIIPDRSLSLADGAIKPWGGRATGRMEYRDLSDFCRRAGIRIDVPFAELAADQQRAIIEGTDDYYGIRGFFNWLETKTYKMHVRVYLSRFRSYDRCPACGGTRFKPAALDYRLGKRTIAEIYAFTVAEALAFFEAQSSAGDAATHLILEEIGGRLRFLGDVGLDYLTLDRQSRSLSGGEVQRVALAAALGASLVDALYVLDEPSIGLHPRDTRRLVDTLARLRDQGNTVVVVEHDPDIIRRSDYLLDLGPGAGEEGGHLMYFGPTGRVNGSLTGQYLRGERRIDLPARRRPMDGVDWLTVHAAAAHNLKHIDLRLPLGRFTCLTGVSGSGKSTLVEKVLFRAIKRTKGDDQGRPGAHGGLSGAGAVDDVELVDQRPIGRTPRANALTFTKSLEPVRRLLADTPAAQKAGFGPGHFSFNTAGGRCEACRGEGFERVEMQFLSDVFITCPVCGGRRFTDEVLAVRYRERSIADIFDMTVDEALAFFDGQVRVRAALAPLARVGLGYLRLGQPINTLSGGEAQRLKLSRHLGRGNGRRRLFIFDEPTTGLHLHDIRTLLAALHDLVDAGHSVLVVEHNPEVIKTADWIVDLGPEGGDAGGFVVAAGPPEAVAACAASHTGRFLAPLMSPGAAAEALLGTGEDQRSYDASQEAVIRIEGAREHNLKNLSLDLPRHRLVALTGVSGSGKSTLAFDILFAEGQRRFLEGLAPYVRQYMKILERPDVDRVTGLPPTVAIEQRISHAGRRSTVATLTEVYHFLRLLFARLGRAHCPRCDQALEAFSRDAMVERISRQFGRGPAWVLAPKVANRKGFHKEVLARAIKAGCPEARIDGRRERLVEGMALSRYHLHTIEWVIGRLPVADIGALVDRALVEGDGGLQVEDARGNIHAFSLGGQCPACGIGVSRVDDPQQFSFNSPLGACERCEGLGVVGGQDGRTGRVCPECHGSRLNPRALAVKVCGRTIWDLVQRPAGDLHRSLATLFFETGRRPVATPILAELDTRLELLQQLGLGYLSLARSGQTLSGGEAQRVRLAAQLGSNLTGVGYILDEPTIGLHPRDNHLLIDALIGLRNRGNTVVVVEHDEATIRAADIVIELGPGAGDHGGAVVAIGSPAELARHPASLTGRLLAAGRRPLPDRPRPSSMERAITVRGAVANNLNRVDAAFPLGSLIAVTGVSGSGKSSLLKETLYRGLKAMLAGQKLGEVPCAAIEGWRAVTSVQEVDHSPIGRTPRSVPATYVKIMETLRRLFAATPAARARGYGPGRFSFNMADGRCEACRGQGHPRVEMSFLPDVYVPCEVCAGRRFNADTLAVTYKGQTIAEVLAMTFDEARTFFSAVPDVRRAAGFVAEIGLGYLRLGQPSPTLSGGEAQRIKLARQLARPGNGHTFFILDEPTTGLHGVDVKRLIAVLHRLVDTGNTVAVVEHNLDLVAAADWVIDLGPEGGDGGGKVVFAGSPQDLLAAGHTSHTARFLARHLDRPAA